MLRNKQVFQLLDKLWSSFGAIVMKHKRSQEMYGRPDESEFPAFKIQVVFMLVSYMSLLALVVCLFLQDQGYSVMLVAVIVFAVQVLSLLARVISAIGDEFMVTRKRHVVRGKAGIIYVLVEAGISLFVGVLLLSSIGG